MVRGTLRVSPKRRLPRPVKHTELKRWWGIRVTTPTRGWWVIISSNCPVTHTDVTNAHTIFRPDLPSVRGKTVRQTPAPVVTNYVAVPCSTIDRNQMVMLAVDVFFVNRTALLITLLRKIKFVTADHIPVWTAKSLAKHIDQVVQVPTQAGFTMQTILMDGEFEKVKD